MSSKFLKFCTLATCFFSSLSYGENEVAPILKLDSQVFAIPTLGTKTDGKIKISNEEALRLFELAKKNRSQQIFLGKNECSTCNNQVDVPKDQAANKAPPPDNKSGSDWQVVFLARLGLHSEANGSTLVTPEKSGAEQFNKDFAEIVGLYMSNNLTNESLDLIFQRSGVALSNNSDAAMAYVAAFGEKLVKNYGNSYPGKFIPQLEQIGNLFAGGSAGQCSDIHFLMLKTYKKIVGPNSKAYLVNYQTAKKLHHTDLVVENQGRINIISYGNITQNKPGQGDILAQNSKETAGFGLAYRIFSDAGEIDKMVAHIDTPMGKFLREVTTGVSSYNPFENSNYSAIISGLEKEGGSGVRLFFGELGQGDAVMGVAVDLKGVDKLSADFSLKRYLGTSLSYAHKKFRVDSSSEELHSAVLYVNTGLGVLSPKLDLKGFTIQARSDLALEGGLWFKHYSAMGDSTKNFEGDFNLISRTGVDATLKVSRKFKLDGQVEIELMPSFKTAFPQSTDGSSGAYGLPQTLGVLPNRITGSITGTYQITPQINIFSGVTYQQTPLGGVAQGTVGAGNSTLRASAFIRGAIDRNQTPLFIPGAERQVGLNLVFCPVTGKSATPIACLGATGTKSLENKSWGSTLTGEVRY